MKHRITAALERFSRAMLAPLSYLSAAGLLLVVGALLTSAPLAGVLPFLRWEPVQLAGRIIYKCLTAVISNLSVLFCTGLAAALAKREKHQAAFIALMSYLVYLTAGNVTLTELGLLAQPDALTGLYSTDTPINVCPSIHVFNSVTLMLAYHRCRIFEQPRFRWMRPAADVLCISIVCSTMLLKQHSCIDAALGALLALALDTAFSRMMDTNDLPQMRRI